MKRYGYHRTSTKEQHLDRGITEINAYCSTNNLELEKIFTDQQTGKNFNRPRYTIMKEDVLRAGDELIITEVDRLGRNKQETLRELQYYRDNGIRVKILELPTTLMDLSAMDNAMARMVMETINNIISMKTIFRKMEVVFMMSQNKTTSNQIPLYRKFNLTITEAAQYFNIGEKSLRRVISDNPTADYILMVGNKVLLKRELFERFINETSSI